MGQSCGCSSSEINQNQLSIHTNPEPYLKSSFLESQLLKNN